MTVVSCRWQMADQNWLTGYKIGHQLCKGSLCCTHTYSTTIPDRVVVGTETAQHPCTCVHTHIHNYYAYYALLCNTQNHTISTD